MSGGMDFFTRLALCRVRAGDIYATGGGYLGQQHRPVHRDLAQALQRLHDTGCLTHGAADEHGHRPVTLTIAGANLLGQPEHGGGRHD